MKTALIAILSGLGGVSLTMFTMFKYYNNIRNIVNDIVSLCARTFGWFKSTSTKMSIETNGTTSIDILNRIVPELNLPKFSIEWAKSDEQGKVILEPGKAIVLLKYNRDNTQNIINTTALYIQRTMLNNSKPYLDEGIRKAVDFAIIRSFLNRTPQKDYIITQYVDSCRDDIDMYVDAFEKVLKVEDEGLLTRVLLREYAVWGNRLVGHIFNSELTLESKSFLDFVYNIAIREYDEHTPLAFNEKTLKVAILLIAKYDTYAVSGVEPYLRRIKEGFAKGINTFYLLARNKKIDILNEVYAQLISTGNYNLLNGPEIYKDNSGRDNICYCIEVRQDADLAKGYSIINQRILEEKSIEVSITNVYKDSVLCDFEGIPVNINRNEITDNPELQLQSYYTVGMTIEVIPIKFGDGGCAEASLLSTRSNPKTLVDNNYSVGTIIKAVVQYVDDEFIKLLVKDTSQECVAYRRNLTFNRFEYLHKMFPIGSEYEFEIIDIEYIYNCLELKLTTLCDPWDSCTLKVGDKLDITIYNIRETFFETEIDGGLYAILPFSELAWFDSDVDQIRKDLKRNSCVTTTIKRINKDERLVILSCKSSKSPYSDRFNQMNKQNTLSVRIDSMNSYGILGLTENKYHVFIPLSETYIGDNKFNVKMGKSYPVHIIDVSNRENSFIGSFKPFIEHPLEKFKELFSEGQVLLHLNIAKSVQGGLFFSITVGNQHITDAFLPNSEVSHFCYIKNLNILFENGFTCPLIIKKIDLKKNQVILSLKELTMRNLQKLSSLEFGVEYIGTIIGNNYNKYSVLLNDIWTEVLIESNNRHNIGEQISIYKVSASEFVFSEDLTI